jgi:hypothetical protein
MKFKIGDRVKPKKGMESFMLLRVGEIVSIIDCRNIRIKSIRSIDKQYIGSTYTYEEADLELAFKNEQERLNYIYRR